MNPVTRSRLVSNLVTRLCLAGAVFGSAAMASLAAQAAQIGASATYTLVTAPPALTLSDPTPMEFGQLYIPTTNSFTYELFPVQNRPIPFFAHFGITRFGQRGSITIENGIPGTVYRLMTRALSDSPSSVSSASSCVINGVDSTRVGFFPVAAYDKAIILNGHTLTFKAGVKELVLGGSLHVHPGAPPGTGSCTFVVSLVET